MASTRHGFIVLAAFTLLAGPAAAQVDAVATVSVQLRNEAAAPPSTLERTESHLGEILGKARINLSPPGAPAPPLTLLIILTSKRPSSMLVVGPTVLGLAAEGRHGGGRIAYVFYDRSLSYARTHSINPALLLAYVVAHEIGHLLLPPPSHGKDGIMKGFWTLADLRDARVGEMAFMPVESEAMRRYVLSIPPAVLAQARID